MDKLTSILAVMDPADESRRVLTKAIVLARHFRARIELFFCDSEQDYVLRHSSDPLGALQGREHCLRVGERYLQALRGTVPQDVTVSTHVACESPLYQAIVTRADQLQPDLVVKAAAGRHPLQRLTLDANDWQLARTCPVPLFLTRGRPWSPVPHFAAALDIKDPQGTSLPRTILQAASVLSSGCRAQLDVIYSDADPEGHQQRAEELNRLAREFVGQVDQLELLPGEPEETLPAFLGRQHYDLLVMGALTRRPSLASLVGTLTSKLVDALDCDFLLVKRGTRRHCVDTDAPRPGLSHPAPHVLT